MEPVLTPAEMSDVDAAAPVPTAELIRRAGFAVAREALRMLGGGYGRRVTIHVGTGNNGADGRAAAEVLRREGVRCEVLELGERSHHAPDLVIDGCVGTGLARPFEPPPLADAPVLAIDIPSGIDGLTGEVRGRAIRADRTVTFAAWKSGLLLGDGPNHTGDVVVVDIGLDVSPEGVVLSDTMLLGDDDLELWPQRTRDAHKWKSAVWVIGGQPGMAGAPSLAAEAAARTGAGYVAISTPGGHATAHREAVSVDLPEAGWMSTVSQRGGRFQAMVLGPGLHPGALHDDLAGVLSLGTPTVLDAGALDLVARDPSMVAGRPVVLTPHEGEFERLVGRRPSPDRIASVREAAREFGAVVLLKGPATIVADPLGAVRVITGGDARLATAGTGDVLAGVIAAGLAGGLSPLDAASMGAQLHGHAARRTGRRSIVASDLLSYLLA